jgi:hypothetical protein
MCTHESAHTAIRLDTSFAELFRRTGRPRLETFAIEGREETFAFRVHHPTMLAICFVFPIRLESCPTLVPPSWCLRKKGPESMLLGARYMWMVFVARIRAHNFQCVALAPLCQRCWFSFATDTCSAALRDSTCNVHMLGTLSGLLNTVFEEVCMPPASLCEVNPITPWPGLRPLVRARHTLHLIPGHTPHPILGRTPHPIPPTAAVSIEVYIISGRLCLLHAVFRGHH